MFNPQNHQQKRRKVFMDSVEPVANILAFITAFLLTPEIFGRTLEPFSNFVAARYGTDLLDLFQVGWFIAVALLTFYMARATVATAIVAAGLAAAMRFI